MNKIAPGLTRHYYYYVLYKLLSRPFEKHMNKQNSHQWNKLTVQESTETTSEVAYLGQSQRVVLGETSLRWKAS